MPPRQSGTLDLPSATVVFLEGRDTEERAKTRNQGLVLLKPKGPKTPPNFAKWQTKLRPAATGNGTMEGQYNIHTGVKKKNTLESCRQGLQWMHLQSVATDFPIAVATAEAGR